MMTSFSHGVVSMEELQSLASDLKVGLAAMQILQKRYDADMWDIEDPSYTKIRHIQIHLAITVGKLARLIEPADHKFYHEEDVPVAEILTEAEPILADLLMHCAQLANLGDTSLSSMFLARYRENSVRFAPQSQLSKLE